ncbi:MAG: zinc-dependent metalloprotease [Acidimicrobiia bacterium]
MTGSGRLAAKIAGTYPLAETYHRKALESDMIRFTSETSEVVPEATGLELSGIPTTLVIDRPEWIRRNLATFAHLTEPARRQLEERMAEAGPAGQRAAALAGRLVDAETTAVLGLLSRRVLGQYELVLPTGDAGDTVSYVGPNILQLERQHQFRPSEFRYWVALHELTHRAQFQGVPWLRRYFLALVEKLVAQSQPEPGRIIRVMTELGRRRMAGEPLIDERGLFGLFASPKQSEMMDRVQALMALLEGHGHVVMDRVGARRLRSQERMSRLLKARRQDKRAAAFLRLTGLEMKMRQYELGERFVLAVERKAGWTTVNRAFQGKEYLPTLEEIKHPSRWLARVA